MVTLTQRSLSSSGSDLGSSSGTNGEEADFATRPVGSESRERRNTTLSNSSSAVSNDALGFDQYISSQVCNEGATFSETYSDGSVYVGQFRNGSREGEGRLEYANGDVYQGQFVEDRRHHRGRLLYALGDVYEGEFCRDALEGSGILQSQGGWLYEGEFRDNLIHGEGVLQYNQGGFAIEPLPGQLLCGPLQPAVSATSTPLTIREVLEAIQQVGCYRGQFQRGVRHGAGRIEFQVFSGGQADVDGAAAKARPAEREVPPKRSAAHYLEGLWAEGEQEGAGVLRVHGHVLYEGEFQRDEACGRGKLVRWFAEEDTDTFEGAFLAGAAHGQGRYCGIQQSRYSGEFQRGLRHGQGTFQLRDTLYVGEFRGGAREGVGEYKAPSISYVGSYQANERHGQGKLLEWDAAGRRTSYQGEFAESLRHGQGHLVCEDLEYEGSWLRNMRHGQGRQCWRGTGRTYEGQWQDDKAHGEGELQTRKIRYKGQFAGGEQEGDGEQTWLHESGHRYSGRFLKNRPHGLGTFDFGATGESYHGHLEEGIPHGSGTYQYSDGSRYSGEWLFGKQHGEGQLSYADGRAYRGQFHDDALQGHGAFMQTDGSVFQGGFSNSRRCGEITKFGADGRREMRSYDQDGRETRRRPWPGEEPPEPTATFRAQRAAMWQRLLQGGP